LLQPSFVQGTPLAAGEYRVTVLGEKATFHNGKQTWTVDVKVINQEEKFDTTAIRFVTRDGQHVMTEISIGGSKTKLVFEPPMGS
jgi:hypothetical protein